jgi:predicted N-acetyltransferase YhbS
MVRKQFKNSAADIRYLADHREVIPIVAAWIYDEWSFLYHGKTVQYVEKFLRGRLHKKRLPLTLVAFKGEKPVGTVSLKEFDMEGRSDLKSWVTSLYVLEQWRGRGIGSGLMTALEQKAAGLGIHKLLLFTADPGLAARFYSRSGWKVKETTKYYSYPVIIMEKDL